MIERKNFKNGERKNFLSREKNFLVHIMLQITFPKKKNFTRKKIMLVFRFFEKSIDRNKLRGEELLRRIGMISSRKD